MYEGSTNSLPDSENHSSPIDAEQKIDKFDDLNLDEKRGSTWRWVNSKPQLKILYLIMTPQICFTFLRHKCFQS